MVADSSILCNSENQSWRYKKYDVLSNLFVEFNPIKNLALRSTFLPIFNLLTMVCMQVLILSVIKVHKLLHGMRKLPFELGLG